MPLIIEFVGGPYHGERKSIEGLPDAEAKDGDCLRVEGSEGEFYVYEIAASQAYFVKVENP